MHNFFIMICFPSIIAYFLVLYEKKHKHCDYGVAQDLLSMLFFYVIFFIKIITQKKVLKERVIMDSMFNTPQEVVRANMNGAVKKATTSKESFFSWESWLVSASRLAHGQ